MGATRRLVVICSLMVLFASACATPLTPAQRVEKYGPNPPVIDRYGVMSEATAGRTWRVYLAAHDPDGDMARVEFDLKQPGYSTRDHWKTLDPQLTGSFSGYFYLHIPPASGMWGEAVIGAPLRMRVRVVDEAGHKSEEVVLPFKVVLPFVEQELPKDFQGVEVQELGAILIRLKLERRWGAWF